MMHALRERTGGTVSLVIPDDQGCSVLDAVPGTEVLPVQVYAGLAMPSTAAAALVLDPRPAPDRVNVVAGWANDHEAVLNDLTCYAAAIRVAGEIEAVLQLSTLSRSPASQFATLTRTAAKRIADALPVTR